MLTMSKICSGTLVVGAVAVIACGGSGTQGTRAAPSPEPDPRVIPQAGTPTPDMSELYRQIGLMAAPGPVAFVGKISAFASRSPDTTLVLVSVSLPNRALTFTREGDRYRAPYEVNLSLNRGSGEAASVNAMEIVRVGSFREINRSDESERDLSALFPCSTGFVYPLRHSSRCRRLPRSDPAGVGNSSFAWCRSALHAGDDLRSKRSNSA